MEQDRVELSTPALSERCSNQLSYCSKSQLKKIYIKNQLKKKIFIPYTIPGEKVEIKIEKDFKDYSIAKNLNIIEKSRYRTVPFCPYYGKCGGCNLQHIEPEFQRQLRVQTLKDAFFPISPPSCSWNLAL